MSQTTITLPIDTDTNRVISDIAAEWGYKNYGNGGKTGFVSDLLDCIAKNYESKSSDFDLSLVIKKKQEKGR